MEVSLFLLLSCNTLILQYSQRMHSLPQFTRSTRGGELARVGAIIFEGNFTVSEKFSSEQFSLGAVVQGAFILGSNYPRGQLFGKQLSGANSPQEQLSGHPQKCRSKQGRQCVKASSKTALLLCASKIAPSKNTFLTLFTPEIIR